MDTLPETYLKNINLNVAELEGPPTPRWMRDMVLYEIYTRNFSKEGTFQGIINKLGHIIELGATAIWLMPIHPVGQVEKKGGLGCPYSISDYFEINPEYGTDDDFRKLVETAHGRGLKVFIDFVANHTAHDHVKTATNPDWFHRDEDGNFTRRAEDWTDIMDINYQHPEAWKHMKEAGRYWVEKFDIDGYRCDVAGMVPIGFWEELAADLREIKPDFYMLAEWDGHNSWQLCRKAFQSDYKGDEYRKMQSVNRGKVPAQSLVELWTDLRKLYPKNFLPLNFVENHDQQPAVKVFGKEEFKPFAGFIFSIPGIPLLYSGQEIGRDHYLSLFDKELIDWENPNTEIYGFYRKLTRFRKNHIATRDGRVEPVDSDLPGEVMAFFIHHKNENLLFTANTSGKPVDFEIDAGEAWKNGFEAVLALDENSSAQNDDQKIRFKLEPYSFMVVSFQV